MNPNLTCPSCGLTHDNYIKMEKANNTVCRCKSCNTFIKNLSKEDKYGTKEDAYEIWHKTLGRCAYCGSTPNPHSANFTYDHLQPQSRGGKHDAENLYICCKSCNSQKGNKTVEEYRDYLEMKKQSNHVFYFELHRPIPIRDLLLLLYDK